MDGMARLGLAVTRRRAALGPAIGMAPLLVAVAVAAPAHGRAQTASVADSMRVTGIVVDQVSGEPLPGAEVSFLAGDAAGTAPSGARGEAQGILWAGVTDDDGWFDSPLLAAASFTLQVEALGFRPASRPVELQAGRLVEIRVELVPEPLELDPVVVVSARRSRLEAAGFYERRRAGQGYTLTRAEFESRNPSRVSDIFRLVPGVQLEISRRSPGAPLIRFRGCYPDVVLDGVPLVGLVALDDILSVNHVEAVEVHSGTFFPARPGRRSCGTVMVWTRDPGQMGGGGPLSLKKLLVVAVLAGLSILLTR